MAYSSALKMEAQCSSETFGDFHQTSRRDIPDDRTLVNIPVSKVRRERLEIVSKSTEVTCHSETHKKRKRSVHWDE
jgi:hypothetical protein